MSNETINLIVIGFWYITLATCLLASFYFKRKGNKAAEKKAMWALVGSGFTVIVVIQILTYYGLW